MGDAYQTYTHGDAKAQPSLHSLLRKLPKIDLHRHLEGSLRLTTLAEIAQEHGIDLPAQGTEELRPYVQVTNQDTSFHQFLAKFQLLRRFYRSQQAVERIAYEAVADAADDNIRYLELRFNPVALSRNQNFSLDEVTRWVCHSIERAQEDYDTMVRLILQIGRDESLKIAEEIAELAVAYQSLGVVGIDLAGDEVNYPPQRFAPVFQRASREGLGITVHAGEAGGADNVHAAVQLLNATRIGHGVRVVENSEVVRFVRERGVVLEVCPTSNLLTGVVRSLTHHPLPDLFSLGIKVTINTDDPSVCDTTLSDEYMVAINVSNLNLDHIQLALFNAIDAAFLTDAEKHTLRRKFTTWQDEEPVYQVIHERLACNV
ncbi:MAG: adenosine deaminase [Anaerolineae bacterium]|nr:adenosine deaminase [Anaerolineae bacterium]